MRAARGSLLAGITACVVCASGLAASPAAGSVSPAEAAVAVAATKPAPGAREIEKPPPGPNPYLALVANPTGIDYDQWQSYLSAKAESRAAQLRQSRRGAATPAVGERERPESKGANDTRATAQRVWSFGTGRGRSQAVRIDGALAPVAASPQQLPASREDDGSIPLARSTGVGRSGGAVVVEGRIGDGPHASAGSGSGDFDFYELDVRAEHQITLEVQAPGGELDPMVALFNAAGEVVAFNDDFNGLESYLQVVADADGRYYAMVTGFAASPANPFDSGSGTGAGSEGRYRVTIESGQADVDYYALRLRKGDVIGVSVAGGAFQAAVFEARGVQVMGSRQDLTFIYPAASPLPGGGNAVADHVADRNGWHYLAITRGRGAYEATVEAYRPGLEGSRTPQTLFLDFDGARLNTDIFGGPGVRTLSPLRTFLRNWGLRDSDLDAVIDAVIAGVEENLSRDPAARGVDPRSHVDVRNSRDDRELFGRPNVSRVVVGGTIEESGIFTIGIAQSIDPGNFETEDTALVLLDLLSEQSGAAYSLNTYLRGRSDRVGFIGRAIGNLVAHEAGHFVGNWHVDSLNQRANLMDEGGNFRVLFGVGRDGVGGTGDDLDVDFGVDSFSQFEGFTGFEDTLSRTAFGLSG